MAYSKYNHMYKYAVQGMILGEQTKRHAAVFERFSNLTEAKEFLNLPEMVIAVAYDMHYGNVIGWKDTHNSQWKEGK